MRRAIGMGCVIGSIAIVGMVAFATFAVVSSLGDFAGKIVTTIASATVLVGLLAAFFRLAIRRPNPLKRTIAGVLVTIALWTVTSAIFSYYVATLARYSTLYGSLAAVAILLFWLWLLALALLVGGEVTAQLDGLRSDDAPPCVAGHRTGDEAQPGIRSGECSQCAQSVKAISPGCRGGSCRPQTCRRRLATGSDPSPVWSVEP